MVSTNVVFSEDTPFYSSPPNSKSEGNGEHWLIYQVTIPSIPTDSSEQPHAVVDLLFAPAKPPIVQEYSRHQEIKDTCPALTSSLSDPPSDLDLPIGLRKGKRQCKSVYSIANFVSYDHLSPSLSAYINCCFSALAPAPVGYKKCIPSRRSPGRNIYGVTTWVCCSWRVWESVSSQKISLWIEAESPSLVW